MFSQVVLGAFFKKRDNHRQFQWQKILRKKNFKIQQLVFNLIVINESDSDTISHSRSMNIKFSPTTENSRHTPSDSGSNDGFFSITINEKLIPHTQKINERKKLSLF